MEDVTFTVPRSTAIRNLFVETVFGRDLFDEIITRYGKNAWAIYIERIMANGWGDRRGAIPDPAIRDYCMPVGIRIDLSDQNFRDADLSGLDLSIPNLDGSDFCGADLTGVKISQARRARFCGAHLVNAVIDPSLNNINVWSPNLDGADFSGSKLIGASIWQARGAIFCGADLRFATFRGDVSGADFTGAKFEGTVFDDKVAFTCGRFRMPRGLPDEYLAKCERQPESCYYTPNSPQKVIRHQSLKVQAKLHSYWHEREDVEIA